MTEYDYEKRVALWWVVKVTLPDGTHYQTDELPERKYKIFSLPDALEYAHGVQDLLNMKNGTKIALYDSKRRGRQYTDGKDGFEYIDIYCKQGEGLVLKADSQIYIGDFIDYFSGNYKWLFDPPGKRGIRVIDRDTIYRGWWITGSSFYMTNDTTKDSMDLSAVGRDNIVEFVPLEVTQQQ